MSSLFFLLKKVCVCARHFWFLQITFVMELACNIRQCHVWLAGVHVIVNASSGAADSNSTRTALIVILGTSLLVQDSVFEGLHLSHDTVLILADSTAMLRNTSFIDNQAATYGALRTAAMQQLIISNCTFVLNTGTEAMICPSPFTSTPLVPAQCSNHTV